MRPVKHVQTLTENRYSSKKFNDITFEGNSGLCARETNLCTFLRFRSACIRRSDEFKFNREHSTVHEGQPEWSVAGVYRSV